MGKSWLKFGISALLAVLMVGGIFAGSIQIKHSRIIRIEEVR